MSAIRASLAPAVHPKRTDSRLGLLFGPIGDHFDLHSFGQVNDVIENQSISTTGRTVPMAARRKPTTRTRDRRRASSFFAGNGIKVCCSIKCIVASLH